MRKLIFIAAIFLTGIVNAQTIEEATKALKKVKNADQLEKLKSKYPDWKISLDKTMIYDSINFPDIVGAKVGAIVLKQYNPKAPKFIMKIVSIENEELCKAKYIYLSGNAYSRFGIDSLRTLIIKRYERGENFESLVKEYTMDKNPTGDLDWFYKGMMVEEFDAAVRKRSKGDIFTVDVDSKNWYYVVLKTHDNKIEKSIKAVKIMYN